MSVTACAVRPARRLLVAGTALLVASSAVSGLAFAESDTGYPPGDSRGTVSSGSVNAGATVTFAATGYDPGEAIAIALSSGGQTHPYGSVKADPTGATSTRVVVDQSGFVTLSATGQFSGHMATAVVSVSGGGRGGLLLAASESSSLGPYSLAGISWLSIAAMTLAGAVRVLVVRAKSLAPARGGVAFSATPQPSVRAPRSSGRKPAAKGGKHRKR
ncbi:MAG: hypothetical protein QOF57_2790 [Frankiaceae bacterium]|nr:hypothetical protein [Frankiaceae bacterium]